MKTEPRELAQHVVVEAVFWGAFVSGLVSLGFRAARSAAKQRYGSIKTTRKG